MTVRPKVKPSDLPTKRVRGPNGEIVQLKVVQSESPTLPYDLLAAFRSNVRRITENRRKIARVADDTTEA